MYDKNFAKVYNQDWSWFSEQLAETVKSKFNLTGKLLDLGCGTGNFLKMLEPFFEKCVGIDISKSMIAIAKKNCKKSELINENILNISLPDEFNLITCNFDMINHLNNLEEYQTAFEKAYQHLKADGTFLFDFNTNIKFESIEVEEDTREDEKHLIRFKYVKQDNNHVECQIKVFDKETKEKVAQINQVESFFDAKNIKKALKAAGFKTIKFVDKDLQPTPTDTAKRLFVICKK